MLLYSYAYAAQGNIEVNVYAFVRNNPDGSIVVTDGQREFVCHMRGDAYYCGEK